MLNQALQAPESTIIITGLQGWLPVSVHLDSMTIADKKGQWLVIQDVDINWSLFALFSGTIQVNQATVKTVQMLRLPESNSKPNQAQPSARENSLPALPDSLPPVLVDQLELGEIIFKSDVIGQRLVLHLNAKGQYDEAGKNIVYQLELKNKPDNTHLQLQLTLQPDPLTLALKMDLTDQQLLADLLQFEALKNLKLSLQSQGALKNQQLQLTLKSDQLKWMRSQIQWQIDQDINLAWSGKIEPDLQRLPDDVRSFVNATHQFDLAAILTATQHLQLDHLILKNDYIEAMLTAEMDLFEQTLNANMEIKASQLGAFQALVHKEMTGNAILTAHLAGKMKQPEAQVVFALNDFALDQITIKQLKNNTTLSWNQKNSLMIENKGAINAFAIKNFEQLPDKNATWQIKTTLPSADIIQLDQLLFATDHSQIKASGHLNLKSQSGIIKSAIQIPLLSAYVKPFLEDELEGQFKLNIDTTLKSFKDIDVTMQGGVFEIKGLPESVIPMINDAIHLKSQANIKLGKTLSIPELALTTAGIQLNQQLAYDFKTQQLDVEQSIVMNELERLAALLKQPIQGELKVNNKLTGELDHLQIKQLVTVPQLMIANQTLNQVQLNLDTAYVNQVIESQLKLAFNHSGQPVQLTSPIRFEADQLTLDPLLLTMPATNFNAHLAVDTKNKKIAGNVSMAVTDLKKLQPWLKQQVSGVLKLDVLFLPQSAAQEMVLNGHLESIKSGDMSLKALTIQGHARQQTDKIQFDVVTKIEQAQIKQHQIHSGFIKAGGQPEQIAFETEWLGKVLKPFEVKASANLDLRPHISLKLAQLEGQFSQKSFHLNNPLLLIHDQNRWQVKALDFDFDQANLKGDADYGAAVTQAKLSLKLPLPLLQTFDGPNLQGELRSELDIHGPSDQPQLALNVVIDDMTSLETELAKPPVADVKAMAHYHHNQLSASIKIEKLTQKPIQVNAVIPITLSAKPPVFKYLKTKPVQATVDAMIELQQIADLVGLDGQKLMGQFISSLKIEVLDQVPTVHGIMTLNNGYYENEDTGTLLKNIQLHIIGEQETLSLSKLQASDSDTGVMTGLGSLTNKPAMHFPYQFNIKLDKVKLLQRDDLSVKMSGDVNVAGNNQNAKISGLMTPNRIQFYIPEKMGETTYQLEIQTPENQSVKTTTPPQFPIGLDLKVNAPGKIYVAGRGLESEWKGNLNIKGDAKKPQISGDLTVLRGHFDFLDKRFNIKQGGINFDGDYPPDPTIKLISEVKGKAITVIIRLTGNAAKPDIELDSVPILPQDEILASLLFDRKLGEITALQAAQLAMAIRTLQGKGGGPDLSSKAREFLGVDTLDITDEGVTAGKYISDKVYLEVERGLTQGGNKATVEIEMTPTISIETEVDENSQSGVGVRWEYDY